VRLGDHRPDGLFPAPAVAVQADQRDGDRPPDSVVEDLHHPVAVDRRLAYRAQVFVEAGQQARPRGQLSERRQAVGARASGVQADECLGEPAHVIGAAPGRGLDPLGDHPDILPPEAPERPPITCDCCGQLRQDLQG
jgi:hypothetical protein